VIVADLKSSLQNEQLATVSMQAKIDSLREELQAALELESQRISNRDAQSDEVLLGPPNPSYFTPFHPINTYII
jgi:hypothetical protein